MKKIIRVQNATAADPHGAQWAPHVRVTMPLALFHTINAAFDALMLLPIEKRQVEGVDVAAQLVPLARAARLYLEGRQVTTVAME